MHLTLFTTLVHLRIPIFSIFHNPLKKTTKITFKYSFAPFRRRFEDDIDMNPLRSNVLLCQRQTNTLQSHCVNNKHAKRTDILRQKRSSKKAHKIDNEYIATLCTCPRQSPITEECVRRTKAFFWTPAPIDGVVLHHPRVTAGWSTLADLRARGPAGDRWCFVEDAQHDRTRPMPTGNCQVRHCYAPTPRETTHAL